MKYWYLPGKGIDMGMRRGLLLAPWLLFGLAGALPAQAGGVEALKAFVQSTRGAQGNFTQAVLARSGRKPQVSEGSFAFQRPGRFRWDYRTPYPQLLVSDGEKLWAWDRDLNQVTVKRLGDALGASPAAILAGDGAVEKNFELAEGGSADGLSWVEARPKSGESTFQSMRLGFAGGQLRQMELKDNFGQTTLLTFTRLERNPALDPALFRFEPPPGADVVGD